MLSELMRPLGDLVEQRTEKIVSGKSPNLPYLGLEHLAQGEPRVVGTAHSSTSTSTNSVFQSGDILFGKLRPYLQKSVQVDFPGYCSTEVMVFRAIEGTWPAFAAKVFQWEPVFDEAMRTAEGTKMPRTDWGRLKHWRTFAPPRPEQRRIAEVLDAADEAIRRSEALLAKLEQVKAGLLRDLLTRGLDKTGRLRDPEAHPEQFQDSILGRIPRAWTVGTLMDRVELPQGQVDPRIESYCDLPLVAPDHMESGTGRLLALVTAKSQGAISGKYLFEATDVLYSKVRPHLRKAVWPRQSGLCSADVYPLRPLPSLDAGFLLAVLIGDHFSRFSEAISMRSGFPKINRSELALYRCAWPPLSEQRRIAATLDAHDARLRAERAQLDKLRQIKKGLMHDLLTGKVRVQVPQEAMA